MILAIVQARMGSSRLPNKSMLSLHGDPVVKWVFHRVGKARLLDDLVFAIPDVEQDDPLYIFLKGLSANVFRGSELDLIDRFYNAAKEWKADPFVSLDTLRYTYWYALNLIEDQRIESFMSKLYLNNKKRFYKAKVIVGRELTSMAQSSLQTLERVRFLRDDLIDHSSYDLAKEVLNKVEGTGQTGALLGLKMFKPLIDDYIDEMIHNEHNWKRDLSNWGTPPDYSESNSVDTSYLHHDSFEDSRRDGEKVIQKIKEKLSGAIDPSDITTRDIIIDDGSHIPIKLVGENIHLLSNSMNRGKGYSLLKGMRYGITSGFTHVITIDDDYRRTKVEIIENTTILISQGIEVTIIAGETTLVEGNEINGEEMEISNEMGDYLDKYTDTSILGFS